LSWRSDSESRNLKEMFLRYYIAMNFGFECDCSWKINFSVTRVLYDILEALLAAG